MLNYARVFVYSLSPEGKFIRFNEYVVSETGYEPEDIHGKFFWDFVHPDYKNEVISFYLNQLSEKIEFTVKEFPIVSRSGESIWMQQEVCAQFDREGEIAHFEIFGTIITDRKKAELELQEIVEKHQRLMKEIPDGYYRLDLKGNLMEYNDSLLGLIGYDEESALGLNYRQLSPDKETADFTRKVFHRVFVTKERLKELEWELVKRNGEKIYVSTSISPVIDTKTGDVISFEGILRDITERIRKLKEMTSLATRDMLTGLYNRFWFIEFVKKDMAKGSRTGKGVAAILFIDGNDFKEVNDNCGHEAGDVILKKISAALLESVRKTDVISRYGGDEFCIYLSGIEKNVEAVIQKIISNVNEIPYRISIGCRTIDYTEDRVCTIDECYDRVLREADRNLYAVKNMVKKEKEPVVIDGTSLMISSSAYKIDDEKEKGYS